MIKTILQSKATREFPYIKEFACDGDADEHYLFLHENFDDKILCEKLAYNNWCDLVWYLFYIGEKPSIKDISQMFREVCYSDVTFVLSGLKQVN